MILRLFPVQKSDCFTDLCEQQKKSSSGYWEETLAFLRAAIAKQGTEKSRHLKEVFE